MLSIELCNRQALVPLDAARLKNAAAAVLGDAGFDDGYLSIAIVDDAEIHNLNRQYLAHDFATDVLSFVLEQEGAHLEGEVIASAETAARCAAEYGWTPGDELLLYVIHGTLHLAGHDDLEDEPRAAMRAAERRYLERFGAREPDDAGNRAGRD
jgi:probable rRNA maturation factor